MGTKDDGNEAMDKVTMDDLKSLETTLLKSFEAKMEEMNQMIARLTSSIAPSPSSSEAPTPSSKEKGNTGSKDDDVEGEKLNGSTSKKGSGKEEYSEVRHVYSPDPPIPHPHINNRGDPPKLTASSFNQ